MCYMAELKTILTFRGFKGQISQNAIYTVIQKWLNSAPL